MVDARVETFWTPAPASLNMTRVQLQFFATTCAASKSSIPTLPRPVIQLTDMPLIQEYHESLPYIDTEPSTTALTNAKALIDADLPADHATTLHPSIPASYEPHFSELIEQEHQRIAAGTKAPPAIDLSRYEALEPPPATDPTSDETRPEVLEQWKETLRKAYTSSTYLQSRLQNLSLLETYGKNAWLISNSQLEDILKSLETELANTKAEVEQVEAVRRNQQEAVAGEVRGLEEAWRKGVGRMIETEVAAEGVRGEILARRRAGAV